VRALGLIRTVPDIKETVLKTQNGAPIRVKDIAEGVQGAKIRFLGGLVGALVLSIFLLPTLCLDHP
jgi:Cu/Ag efflux pump CusA